MSRETRTQLLELLENKFTGHWKRISEVFILDDVETFAEGIVNLGDQYRLSLLTRWGNKLLHEIQNYDIENSHLTLTGFPELIKKIKAHAESGNQ